MGEFYIRIHCYGVYGFQYGYTTFSCCHEETILKRWGGTDLFPRRGDLPPSLWLSGSNLSCRGVNMPIKAKVGDIVGAHIDRTGAVPKVWYTFNGEKLDGSEHEWPTLPADQHAYPAYNTQWYTDIEVYIRD
eukprot:TRINITY_DN34772_c0_g1_i2.p1 TRINITY_DN34772_c0_g1~~TRINITY_DN34772_c0_g1_i2.p1  ORF type:complete len:132 (-),score=15.46 TRINITY_DN34772_c0_g1_i2:127-522(-)